jgi:hypothetical protein
LIPSCPLRKGVPEVKEIPAFTGTRQDDGDRTTRGLDLKPAVVVLEGG